MPNPAVYFVKRHIKEGRGKNVAIVCGDTRLTYRDLDGKINRASNGFLQLGIRAGDRILIVLPDIPEFIISFLAALKIGAVPVPVSTLLAPKDYEFFVKDSGARLVIDKTSLVPGGFFEKLFLENSAELDATGAADDDDAGTFWLYSSGSTGLPKACVHSGRDMITCATSYAEEVLHMTEHDRCFSASKLFFSYGLGNSLYFPLSVGATIILMPESPKPEQVFKVIERHKPTIFFSVPSMYIKLLEYASNLGGVSALVPMLSSVRIAVSAGEQLSSVLFHRFKKIFGVEILDCVGSTEAFLFLSNRPGTVVPGSGGQLLSGCQAKILDGDLFIRSDALFSEYWNQPKKTADAFHDGWFKTGDRFYQDKDGFFWYLGRSDDMIKSSGAWVSPIEVEAVLMEHPAIREAAVVGKKDEENENNEIVRPAAFLVLREDFQDTPAFRDELKIFVAKQLPNYKRPHWIEIVKELPRTPTGKLQRFKLREKN
jgi:benzoate-CoA ligase family protein